MIAFSNNGTNGNTIMTSKASVYSDLHALGVELSASKLKKTTLAELQAMLTAKRAEEQKTRKATRSVIDLDAGSPDADVKRASGAKAASKVVQTPRRSRGVNLPAQPAPQLRACRAGSKQAMLIDDLARGATLAELVAALAPWSPGTWSSSAPTPMRGRAGSGSRAGTRSSS